MPIKRIKKAAMPKLHRKHSSFIKTLPEWSAFVEAIARGLKPYEVIEISFPAKVLAKKPNVVRAFQKAARLYLKENKMPYSVVRRGDNGEKRLYICGK